MSEPQLRPEYKTTLLESLRATRDSIDKAIVEAEAGQFGKACFLAAVVGAELYVLFGDASGGIPLGVVHIDG